MHNEFTAIVEKDGEWFISYCPEIPGANGQGHTVEESRENLAEAIAEIAAVATSQTPRGQRVHEADVNSLATPLVAGGASAGGG